MHSDSQTPAFGELGQFEIVDGPSKFDLMTALFLGPWSSSGRVTFKIICAVRHGVYQAKAQSLILGVRGKNTIEEVWGLDGSLSASPDEPEKWRGAPIVAHYSSKTRKGYMEILPKKD